MTSSSSDFGELFDTFREEAFRLETLATYNIPRSERNLRAFLAGEAQPPDYNEEWLSEVRCHTGAGKRVYRVHVLSRPLTDYLRYELGWGYTKNMTAGEEFFILDTTERANPLEGVPDFWFFDSRAAAVMHYDEAGTFLGPEVVPEDRAPEFLRYRETALAHAEPFPDWWSRHRS
ncbi:MULTISPECIES: DUF6879 family protein [Streptomyces]|uniref:DUF6879 domain-containing protein n=2 Tax=Streptomyces TaxID=1883 RepID=A0A3R7LQR4_9ACTN|nr:MULTISPECIES: DUF6879 family protein [Streptomyces]KNE82141.1 hypothetical protein ADZ36_12430 [Streptomyces fradiae]OFA56531.1 hypothetical protein BEN35_06195 [Streptomyces fradiae]PQM22747.1 hypothetical protein Sfr7A_13625 [Streptomyces xinghaiensis]RKM97916.1 hypothetical protein SFRA_005060 [Streptomyces xinghaiensis]RNC73947.1 hypothetical protein DC095_013920 [Streptomyces xinghaiensis]